MIGTMMIGTMMIGTMMIGTIVSARRQRMLATSVAMLVATLAAPLSSLAAQQAGATATAGARGAAAAQGAPVAPRGQLEQRLRERLGRIVREQLQLDDAQAQQLGAVSAKYEGERRALAVRERGLRQQLRDELQGGDQADDTRVSNALDRMLEVQRLRVDILQREQQELAKFLTPVQRAKYLVLQDQVRRRLEEARRSREQGLGAAPVRPRRQQLP